MALYAISIRQARDLPPPFFRFCLTADTLGLSYILPAAGRIRDFHPLERALTGRTRKTPPSRYGSEASFIEVHWFDPAVQKIHIAYLLFCAKKPDRKQTSQSASCPAAISSNSSPSEQGILYHTRAPAQDCQAWLSRRGASGSQTVGPVAISALGDNDILCDQFIQIIPCA